MKSRIVLLSAALACILPGCGGGGGRGSGEFEYSAMGASDAVGVGAQPLTNGYVYLIQESLIKQEGFDVGLQNLGIPAAETGAVRNLELPAAVENEPELVTIFVGPNDIVAGDTTEQFRDDVGVILTELERNTEAKVVIATIPNLTQLPRYIDDPDPNVTVERIDAFNAIIIDEASKHGASIADLAAQPVIEGEVSDDGFHPNDAGHRRIADTFLAVIRPITAPE